MATAGRDHLSVNSLFQDWKKELKAKNREREKYVEVGDRDNGKCKFYVQ